MDACWRRARTTLTPQTTSRRTRPISNIAGNGRTRRGSQKGIMALLGSGFDPGVTNVFTAYAQKHLFDEIDYLDILDCNAGSHGHAFATNFNPEINIREVTQPVRRWDNGGKSRRPR